MTSRGEIDWRGLVGPKTLADAAPFLEILRRHNARVYSIIQDEVLIDVAKENEAALMRDLNEYLKEER